MTGSHSVPHGRSEGTERSEQGGSFISVHVDFDLGVEDYRHRFARIPQSTLLQDALYGRAMARAQGLEPRWGLIRDGETELGVVQVLERHALSGLLGVVVLDRGPLWLPGVDGDVHAGDFFRAFSRRWPRRMGRRRRIVPELPAGERSEALLRAAGCRLLTGEAAARYATFLVPVEGEGRMRSRLHPNWRRWLNRSMAEVAAGRLVLDWPQALPCVPDLLRRHLAQREAIGYRGPAQAELQRLLLDYAKAGQLLIGQAREPDSDQPCAQIALLCHGTTATWQIGWNSEASRRLHANNALLWSAFDALRARGITHLDLGGHDAQHTPQLRSYKAGLGGKEIILAGMHD